MSGYNAAMHDYLGKPAVLTIDVTNWTGQAGQQIRIQAQDNVQVASVRVMIDNNNGTRFEEGEAVQTDGLWWTYTATSAIPQGSARRVIAIAADLPGNTASLFGLY